MYISISPSIYLSILGGAPQGYPLPLRQVRPRHQDEEAPQSGTIMIIKIKSHKSTANY